MQPTGILAATILLTCLCLTCPALAVRPGELDAGDVDTWITTTGKAAGTNMTAQDEAVANALRTAVEQACGTFITSQSKTQDYQTVYDKIFTNSVGYVREHKTPKIWVQDGITYAEVACRVSSQKFEQDWAAIAHTLHQEHNPRVIVAITDATWTSTAPTDESVVAGVVQGKIEDFFLSKGVKLVDRGTAVSVNKRDIILAGMRDDVQALAALGAKFQADVVIYGQAAARYGDQTVLAGHTAYKHSATLNVRAIRTDSAQLIVSKTFGPATATSLQQSGGREKAMASLADEAAPKLLEAVVEAWRQQVQVARDIEMLISGMDYPAWQALRAETAELRGLRSMDLKEMTEGVASITVQYEYDTQTLADRLSELKNVNLQIVEFNPNRLKLKRVE